MEKLLDMNYDYKPTGHKDCDWFIDELVKIGAAIVSDVHEGGNLVLGKASTRKILLAHEHLYIDIICDSKSAQVGFNAADAQRTLLLQHNASLFKNRKALMGLMVEYNKVVGQYIKAAQDAQRIRTQLQTKK